MSKLLPRRELAYLRRKTGSHGPPWESIPRLVLAPVCVTTLERVNESNTYLCTCPARGLRWCPLNSPSRLRESCLPAQPDRRLSPAFAGLSSWTTTMKFSELSYAAYTLATPGFTHTLADYACRFTADSAAHLLGWNLYSVPYAPTG